MLASSESLLWHVLRASECVFSSVSAQYSLPNWLCHPPLQPPLTPATTIAATTNKHTRNIQEMNGNRTENISITDGESPWCQSSSSLSWICFTIVYGNKKNRWARPRVWNRTKWSTNALIRTVLSVKKIRKKKKEQRNTYAKHTQKKVQGRRSRIHPTSLCLYRCVWAYSVYRPYKKTNDMKVETFFSSNFVKHRKRSGAQIFQQRSKVKNQVLSCNMMRWFS